MFTIINDKFNGVKVVQRNSDGKFGIMEIIEGEEQEPCFSYRTVEMAAKTADAMSKQNDKTDAYENGHR